MRILLKVLLFPLTLFLTLLVAFCRFFCLFSGMEYCSNGAVPLGAGAAFLR